MNYMEIVLKVVSILGYTRMEYFGYKFRCGKNWEKLPKSAQLHNDCTFLHSGCRKKHA